MKSPIKFILFHVIYIAIKRTIEDEFKVIVAKNVWPVSWYLNTYFIIIFGNVVEDIIVFIKNETHNNKIKVVFTSKLQIIRLNLYYNYSHQNHCVFAYWEKWNFLGMEYIGIVSVVYVQKLWYYILQHTCILTATQYFNFVWITYGRKKLYNNFLKYIHFIIERINRKRNTDLH